MLSGKFLPAPFYWLAVGFEKLAWLIRYIWVGLTIVAKVLMV